MGESSAPSPPPAAAADPPGTEAAAGTAVPVASPTTAIGASDAASAARAAASAVTAPGTTAARVPSNRSRPDRRPSEPTPASSSRDGQQQQAQDEDQDASQPGPEVQQQPQQQPQRSPASSITASSATAAPRRRSFFSRFTLPFRTPARTIADFHIRPAEPHRKYVAGDHVLGAVVLAVVKPVRITHLTVSLRGLVRVFKDPNAAATASLPADTATDSSTSATSRLLTANSSSKSSKSSSYLGNGHALLFRDEMVLSGPGRLEPGNYEFEFDLIFPSQGLPSSIDFERGSICYVVTSTLTRPTTVAPTLSCDRRIYLVDPVDIGTVPKPRPRTISLEPISKRSKKRKIVVVTQPPPPENTNGAAGGQSGGPGVLGATSTISFASGGGSSGRHDNAPISEHGSAGDSAHETIRTEDTELDGYAEVQGRTSGTSQPRSSAPTDIRSEVSVESVVSGGSETRSGNGSGARFGTAGGSGSGSGFGSARGTGSGTGAASNIIRLSSPVGSHAAASTTGYSAATTTGTNTSSSTITNPAPGSSSATSNGNRHHGLAHVQSVSTTTISGVVDDRTITATIDLLKGGCLPGEVVSVKVSVQHVKRIKSLHGVVVTLYRQGRIDSAPPDYMFPSAGTSIAEEDEGANGTSNGVLNGSIGGDDANDDQSQPQNQKQKKLKEKEVKDKAKQQKERQKDKEKERSLQQKGNKDKKSGRNGAAKPENYYPKSKTGLGGLSLMSAGTCSVFRKDLSQSFSPLIIDPRTLQSNVTASVRMPEDAFATIKGVPGDMISFKYQLEVIVDLGGKLASLLQSGVGPAAGPNLVSNSSNPYDGKLPTTSALWGGGSHMIDTDPLRRQKGVIFVAFEVVVGTTDTTRQRGRGLKGVADGHQQAVSQQQQQEPQQPPQPYVSHHPPDWYPEDRKTPYQQPPQEPPYPSWPANGMASGSGVAGPSSGPAGPPIDDQYYHQHHPYHQYDQYPQQPDYNVHDYPHPLHHGPHYNYYDDSSSPSAASAPHPPYMDRTPASARAPEYVPTAEMLAANRDTNLTEKERIRRAEQRLLPSQPPTAAPVGNGEGSSSGASRHAPSAPSAPTLDDLDTFATGGPSAPPFDDGTPGPSQPPTEDKQELERRRLLAEASAPPEFPEDYDQAAPGSSRGSRARTTRAYTAGSASSPVGPSFSSGSGAVAGPSAPALEEEDGHHLQYSQNPSYWHGGSQGAASGSASASAPSGPSAPSAPSEPPAPGAGPSARSAPPASALAPSAPPAEALLGDDIGAPSAPPADDVEEVAEGTTDEDQYGRNYTYGPSSGPGAASRSAAEHAEPLPKYER